VDHHSIIEAGEEVFQVPQMSRSFQDPSAAAFSALLLLPLKELEHAVEVVVGGLKILIVEPGSVVREIAGGLGDMGQKRIRKKYDLLFGLVGVGGVDGKEFRGVEAG
jgi:hypothetical protein